jgi:mono/diheme cytochrome c family protein
MRISFLVVTIGLLWSPLAHGRVDEEHREGKDMLQKMCARCHAIGKTGASSNKLAPPFRSFSEDKLYDSSFRERLQNGLISIHPFMPTFRFNRENAEEVLNYMKSIQERPKPK